MNDDDIEKKTIENIKDIINPHFCLEVIKDKVVKIILTEPRASLKKVTIYGFDYEKTTVKNPIPQYFGTCFLKKSDFFDRLKIRFF
jgi:hypothetical protein